MHLYEEFLQIAKVLNKELDIIPVLYGSLGLEKETGIGFSPQDIDILVPFTFLDDKWNLFKSTIEQSGYELIDLHEHEFQKGEIKIGVAFIEDLQQFAGIEYTNLKKEKDTGAIYYTLSSSDYVKVYSKSLIDGYRRKKNNNKDQDKLKVLYELGHH